ncbi:MAG: HAMP domain-containing histidine kinase [Fibrobacteres bacterium]|nr:HAMP domain-containing histidine kinase [Fibrobacterota bacterium]
MRRWGLAFAITGFVVAVLMVITVLVLWNVYIIGDFQTIRQLTGSLEVVRPVPAANHDPTGRWVIVVMGSVFMATVLVALSLFFTSYLVDRRYRSLQTDWLNMTTHELKLPTANIHLFAQTLQRKGLEEYDRNRFIDLILQETRRLDQLVSRILQARRIEGRMQELRMDRVDLREWILEYARRGVSPRFLLEPGPSGLVRLDRLMMESVLDNLLENALKYGDGSSPIVRLGHIQSEAMEIEVIDRGLGVPQKYRKKIFQRFFRIPGKEHRRRTGTGLGLFIAQSAVSLMGGTMGVRDNPTGKGSVFWFRLPILK